MASKQTYPCFACRKADYEIPVFLDGRNSEGRTKYLNEDGTSHVHKIKEQTAAGQGLSTTIVTEPTSLKIINAKLDRIIALLEGQHHQQQQDAEEISALIKEVERDTSKYLISVLQAIVNEQGHTRNLKSETGNYIIDAVKDQARRKGWIE